MIASASRSATIAHPGMAAPIPGSARATVARIAAAFRLTPEQLTGPRRWQDYVEARNVAAWVLRQQTVLAAGEAPQPRSFRWIGQQLGGRDHSSIRHAVQQCELAMQRSPDFARRVLHLARGAAA